MSVNVRIRNGAPFQLTGGDPICGKRNLQKAAGWRLIRCLLNEKSDRDEGIDGVAPSMPSKVPFGTR